MSDTPPSSHKPVQDEPPERGGISTRHSGRHVLSFSQERLWFLNHLTRDNPVYNRPVALELRGPLDRERLQASLNALVRRHEVLRTVFESRDGRPTARVLDEADVPLEVFDPLSDQVTPEDFARQPIDLVYGPTVRAGLFPRGADRHVLVIHIHHTAFDAGSQNILKRDLKALYDGQPLPDLPVQYGDFAVWQRQQIQGDWLQKQIMYWQEILSGVLPVTDLPLDHPRPAIRTYRGRTHRYVLDDTLVSGIDALGRAHHATRFMVLLTAFKILLYRLASQRDVLVGVPVGLRGEFETEELIGNFLNNLVLRLDIDPDVSFADLLSANREIILDALSHRDVPFEKLVEVLQPQRDLSRSPLFQVVFNYERFPEEQVSGGDLTISNYTLDMQLVQYELAVEVMIVDGHVVCDWRYNRDLFDPETVGRFAGHYATLLASITDDPAQLVGQIGILSADEWQRTVVDWNRTEMVFDETLSLHSWIEAAALQAPDRTAAVMGDQSLSYAQLNTKANRLARYLIQLGIRSEDRVGILLEPSLDWPVAMLAVLKAGGAFVPLRPGDPPARVRSLMEDVDSFAVITTSSSIGLFEEADIHVVGLDRDRDRIEAQPTSRPDRPVRSDQLAYIMFTSGTMGKPKGVMVEHRQIVNYLYAVRDALGFEVGHYALVQPFYVDASLTLFLGGLTNGGTLHLFNREQTLDAHMLVDYFKHKRPDYLKLAPSHLQALASSVPLAQLLPSRLLMLGGEAARPELVRAITAVLPPSVRFVNHYGPTETTVGAMVHIAAGQANDEMGLLPIGRPLANTKVYILDENRQPVPVGVDGELYIGGKNVARGYWNRSDLTDQSFVPDSYSTDGKGRLYRTGDRVRYRPDGTIEFRGRVDHQIKVRGFRIEPAEIEMALNQHPKVSQSLVVSHALQSGVMQLIAYVVPDGDQAVSTEEVRHYLTGLLPDYMLPAQAITLDHIPLSPHGKVDWQALPAPRLQPESDSDQIETGDPLEAALISIWQDVLEAGAVGVHDNFFDLGGHSLLILHLIARIEQELGITVPVVALFETPTIADLARTIRADHR